MTNTSQLGTRIINNGPYTPGQDLPFPRAANGHVLITAQELNALRVELISLRAIRDKLPGWSRRIDEALGQDDFSVLDEMRKLIQDVAP